MATKKKPAAHPFEGRIQVLDGAPEVLADKYRKAIEGNWNYRQRVNAHELTPSTPVPGYQRGDTDWMSRGACAGVVSAGIEDDQTFLPDENASKKESRWKAYCDICPVFAECAAFAQRWKLDGIWGGTFYTHGKKGNLRPQGRPGHKPPRKMLANPHRHDRYGVPCERCRTEREERRLSVQQASSEAPSVAVVTS